MFSKLLRLPMAAIMRLRINIAAGRTLRRLKRRGGVCTPSDVGYALAPELVRMFGHRKVMGGIMTKFLTGQLDQMDAGIVRWLKDNHKVEA